MLTAKIDAHIHSGWKSQKMSYSTLLRFDFDKSEACVQTLLPDRSILIGQRLVQNAQIIHMRHLK